MASPDARQMRSSARRHVEHFAPEAEIDPDIDQHRPAESGCGGEHDAAFHHEQNGEKQRQQAGDADDDALIKRKRVDLVLERVRLPQIELRQIRAAQLGHERDDRPGIKRHPEDVGRGVLYSLGRIARRRSDIGDARHAEIGPQQSGTDHAIVRSDDQAVDLLFAVVGEREHGPVVSGLAPAHFDAADDSVGARRGGDLHAVGVGALYFDGIGEVDRGGIDTDIDGVNGAGAGDAEDGSTCERRERDSGAKKCQQTTPSSRRRSRPEKYRVSPRHGRNHSRFCAGFATFLLALVPNRSALRSVACEPPGRKKFSFLIKGSEQFCRYARCAPCAYERPRHWRARRLNRSPV